MSAQRSIVICGGAFAGLALALALRQGLGPDIPVIVADPALAVRPSSDPRATAIVAACRRLFEALFAWTKREGLKSVIGPMNPTTNDECGLLVEGFDSDPFVMMAYNPPYYAGLLERSGLKKIKDAGIEDKTLVIFTSDNGGLSVLEFAGGPSTHNTPYRGGKGYVYEGGLREPTIVRWPALITTGRRIYPSFSDRATTM